LSGGFNACLRGYWAVFNEGAISLSIRDIGLGSEKLD
jgi:hypothetical protein